MTALPELKRRVAAAADGADLIDVAYAHVDSPIGELLVAGTSRGLVRVSIPDEDEDMTHSRLAARISPRILERPERLELARRELDEYFAGRRREFEVGLDWQLTAGFRRRVLEATARIPFGETSTYTAMAAAAGSPRAHRAAGSALGSNPLPVVVPCHRVLRLGGGLGGYGGGLDVKETLLRLEGAR